ncbi:hypothetical protein C8R45DRAFT_1015359 [Mycena sanguinolenta]|nr:hypothetical protein C8R45DRAFT_1015359 [Mycena sanguinolenta]
MPKDASNEPEFPFPGEYGPTGFATQYIRLDKLTNTQLSEYCKTFKLAHTGNKTTLTDRLKNFSKDRSRWDSLIPGATNTHKGARKPQDEKKTKPKKSTIRREDLFQGADGVHTANAPTTERSKDLRTAEEKAAILPWAHRIVAKYPYQQIPGNDTMNPSIYVDSSTPTAITTSTPSIASLQAALPNTETAKLLSDFLAFVRHRDGDLAMQGVNTAAHIAILAPTTSAPSSTSVIPVTLTPTTSAPSLASAIPLSPCLAQDGASPHTNVDIHMTVPSSNLGSNENSPTRTLQLANGRHLLGVWTDKSPDWNGKSPLKVKGVPVPLVYWPLVYKYWKGNQWKGAKKSWFQWKILMQAMTRTSLDEFWVRYSVPDQSGNTVHLKYTPLLKRLEAERKAEDERLAELARVELTEEQLTYRRGADRIVMTKISRIASTYRKLKGLEVGDGGADGEEDEEEY